MLLFSSFYIFFFFNDTATTEIYTLSLHDALPILEIGAGIAGRAGLQDRRQAARGNDPRHLHADRRRDGEGRRSEEHTSELQSLTNLVCRLLLEKKKKQ